MVPSMDTPFLTIAEAGKKTGRSASTIRRLIHSLTENDKHAERDAVQPSPSEVNAFKKKGDSFTWRIREDVVMREFGSAPSGEKKSHQESDTPILDILQKELHLKNQQIEKQLDVIQSLNERLREGNILMGSLQQRLSLGEPVSSSSSVVEAAMDQRAAEVAKKTVKKAMEQVTGEVQQKPKRKLLAWFRS
jgi:hypothetical protein